MRDKNLKMKIRKAWLALLVALLPFSKLLAQADADGDTFTLANPPEMKPIAKHDPPAYRTAEKEHLGERLWDKTNNCPLPGMHAARFGPSK